MNRTSYLIELSALLALGLATGVAADLPVKGTRNTARGLQTSADEKQRKDDPRLGPNSQSGASDLLVKGGTWLVLTGNVKLSVGGNFLNRGTLAPSLGPTVIFGGRSAQAETGFAIFPNLTKTGGGTLTLNNPVAITGTLTLNSGNISLNGNNLEVLSITGGSATSYIITPDTSGGLIRPVNSSTPTFFPVGNSSYNPVSLRTGTGTDLFRVGVIDSLMPTAPSKGAALKRTWLISQSNPPGVNGNIVFSVQWNAGEEGSQFDRSLGGAGSADGWRWGGTSWVKQTNSRFHDNGLGVYPAIDSLVTQNLGFWTLANENVALPIQLASFTATVVEGHHVRVDWTTLSEINNYGFEVQRKGQQDSLFTSLPNIFVPGHGTTNEPHQYSVIDSTATPARWSYRLKQIDLDGTVHYTDPIIIEIPTSVAENNVPSEFSLQQNYPNPFNPSTIIRYGLPRTLAVRILVYNTIGQQVELLVDQEQQAGYHEVAFHADGLASGVYFYRIEAGSFVDTKKMLVVK